MPLFWNVSKIPGSVSGINKENNMKIKVTKLTNVERLRKANSFTTGKESKMSLAKAYCLGHSTIRTQMFAVELTDIPLFVASQLVRSNVGVTWFMRSKRVDRGGVDFKAVCADIADKAHKAWESQDEELIEATAESIERLAEQFDRYAPTDLMCIINAEALINMAHKRLCTKASTETIRVMGVIRAKVKDVDPDLANHMVPVCVFRGGICPEAKPCGVHTNEKLLTEYRNLFAWQRTPQN